MMRFGFEYETLVNLDEVSGQFHKKFKEMLDYVDYIGEKSYTHMHEGKEQKFSDFFCDARSISYDHVKNLYFLGLLYNNFVHKDNNQQQYKFAFKVLDTGKACVVPFIPTPNNNDFIRVKEADVRIFGDPDPDDSEDEGTQTVKSESIVTYISKFFQEDHRGYWVVMLDSSVLYDPETDNNKLYDKDFRNPFPRETALNEENIIDKVEIVSPIMTIDDVKDMLPKYIDDVFTLGKKINYLNTVKTSNHVHVSYGNYFENPEILLKICLAWYAFEPVFMSLVAPWRDNNKYCITMRELLRKKSIPLEDFVTGITGNPKIVDEFLKMFDARWKYASDFEATPLHKVIAFFQGTSRYAALNLLNLINEGIGTIEVRLKHGSSSGEENRNWVLLLAFFFHACVVKPVQLYGMSDEITWNELSDFIKLSQFPDELDQETFSTVTEYFSKRIITKSSGGSSKTNIRKSQKKVI